MPWPTDSGTLATGMTGTTQLSDVVADHAQDHRQLGSIGNSLNTVFGTSPGTNLLRNATLADFLISSNAGGTIQQALKYINGTWSGGTITGQVVNLGTVANGVYGTAQYTGGSFANGVFGTPSVTGGTINTSLRILGSTAYTPAISTTQTIDLSTANRFLITLANSAGSVTLALSNAVANQPFLVEILQGTAGLGTINWFSTIRWAGSAAPTQTTTASRKDTFGFIATGTATFDGYIVGQSL